MYNIKLSNGYIIENLKLNGNNFIPNKSIDINTFDGISKLEIIKNDKSIEKINHFKVVFTKVGGKQSFVIVEKSKEQVEKEKIIEDNKELKQSITEMTMLISMIMEG